jgi:D-3-phosphoglycerate dehydrogenase
VGRKTQVGPIPPINGEVLGLAGLGNIGRAVARKAQVFGLRVIVYDPYLPSWDAREYRVELVGSLDELASRADYVSVHTPLNAETRHIIGESFLRAMKPSAYLINTSRGGTVDEEALVRALQEGRIAGAGLDVFEQEPVSADNPLLKLANTTLTPHTGGRSTRAGEEGDRRVGEEAARILRGTWPMSLVNPEVRSRVQGRAAAVNL